METIASGKILSYINRIIGDRKPITADIFLTNFCNCKCQYCIYKLSKHEQDRSYINYDNFKKYAYRLKELGVKGLILTGGGEPTLNPDFDKICSFLESNSFHYGINTNFNTLKYIKPDYLKVSLDSWDEDSYEKTRGVRRYRKTCENIQKYADWKSKHSPNTVLGIQMVGYNTDEIQKFYDANKDLKVDYISIRPYESINGIYFKNKLEDSSSPEEILKLLAELKAKDDRITINFKWNLLETQETECTANWAQMAIDQNGNVLYCCHKPNEIVGNLLDADILEKKMEAVTDMKTCAIPCRLTAPNKEVKQILDNIQEGFFI